MTKGETMETIVESGSATIPYRALKACAGLVGAETARFVLNAVQVQFMDNGEAWRVEACDGKHLLRVQDSELNRPGDWDRTYLITADLINGAMKVGKNDRLTLIPTESARALRFLTMKRGEGTIRTEEGTFPLTSQIVPAVDLENSEGATIQGIDPLRFSKLLRAVSDAAGSPYKVHHTARFQSCKVTTPAHSDTKSHGPMLITLAGDDCHVTAVLMPCLLDD